MSPTPDDLEELNDPNVGNLGEDPEAFERRRLAHQRADETFNRLTEAQEHIPLREDFGPHSGGSWDSPEATSGAIAAMAAGRAGARIRAAQGLPPRNIVPPPPPARRELTVPPRAEPAPRFDIALPDGFSQEMQLVIHSVVSELGRGLAQKFEDLRLDLEENTRLLGVMNAPMEAIADSHERATASFETLRRDIYAAGRGGEGAAGSSEALQTLTKVIDTAGLSEAQSRAERRFEELAKAIEGALTATRIEFKESINQVGLSMIQVLHLLERLQARELREAKRRMAPAAGT